jgi:Bacterial PH domain
MSDVYWCMSLLSGIMGNASEVEASVVESELGDIFVSGEKIEHAYKLIRDYFVFTNKRMILVDKQGVTGSKSDVKSIPYSSIKAFAKENAGTFDLDAELKIWLQGSDTPIVKTFKRSLDINPVYKTLSGYILH